MNNTGSGNQTELAPQKSKLAIASFVLGLLGLFGGVTTLVGLPMGISALKSIKRSNGQLGGTRLAAAGIVMSVLFLLVFTVALLPPYGHRHDTQLHTRIHCVTNLKQIGLGVRLYAADHGDSFLSGVKWCDELQGEIGSLKIFQCPAVTNQVFGYALNRKVVGKKTSDVQTNTVLVFESDAGWNAVGGRELMITKSRHGKVFTVGYADGSTQQLTQEELMGLRWEP